MYLHRLLLMCIYMVDIYDALDHLLVFLGVVNEIESALRSYECKTTARQYESANFEIKNRKINLKKNGNTK